MIKAWLRSNRQKLERDLAQSRRRRYFSPAYYSQYDITLPLILQHAQGRLIDLGCGDMPFRKLIEPRVTAYDSLDYFPRSKSITYVADIQAMSTIEDNTYDTAICLEVLEHVPDPFRAGREIHRIVRPGGILILSVPHLNRLHEEPHDYYRFTHYGLRTLLEKSGFTVTALKKRGGLFSFLGHQIATLALTSVWQIPLLRDLIWFLNSWLVTRLFYRLDQILDPTGIYAIGYSAVACKRRDEPTGPASNIDAAPPRPGEGAV